MNERTWESERGIPGSDTLNPRILLLNWRDLHNPLAGGSEIHIDEVFRRLAARGWDIAMITAAFHGGRNRETINGIQVYRTGGPYHYALALPRAYRRIAREFRPHLVIDFLNKLPLLSPLYVREPLACFVHHLFGDAAPTELGWPLGAVLRSTERLVPRVYRDTRFLTGSCSTFMDLAHIGIPREHIEILSYGTDTSLYCPGTKSPTPLLVYIGRLKRYKGIDKLIRFLPRLLLDFPELRVRIAGQGDAEGELRTLVGTLGLQNEVELPGFIPEIDKLALYQQAWACFLLSEKEGFGLTVAEAARCGTPTVGFDVPGLRDSIQHEVTGLLVPYNDEEALYSALCRVLSDERIRIRLSDGAEQRYRTFTWDAAAEQMKDALIRLMQSNNVSRGNEGT